MSYTPRTDKAAYEESCPSGWVVDRDIARALERERGHYRVRIAELECQNAELLEALKLAAQFDADGKRMSASAFKQVLVAIRKAEAV